MVVICDGDEMEGAVSVAQGDKARPRWGQLVVVVVVDGCCWVCTVCTTLQLTPHMFVL